MIDPTKVFTGLLDVKQIPIYEGDLIWVGMRRGDVRGWTLERVVRGSGNSDPWMLADPKTGEKMQMQWDQELRGKVNPEA